MTLERIACIPSASDHPPITANLRIDSAGSEYKAHFNPGTVREFSFHIDLKLEDIATNNTTLQKVMGAVSTGFSDLRKMDAVATDFAKSTALFKLAHKGHMVFNQIFPSAIRKKVSGLKQGAIIQIATKDFAIPWELLYDGPLDTKEDLDIYQFWGMRYIVYRVLEIDVSCQDDEPEPDSHIKSPCPTVGLITCNQGQLKHVDNEESKMLCTLQRDNRIRLERLKKLNASEAQHYEELKHIRYFFSRKNLHILHLACHAYKVEPIEESYLLIADDFHLRMQDFIENRFKIIDHPLVILNACLTGTIDPKSALKWAVMFLREGNVRGTVATEFSVPDWFAAAFVTKLYENLLLKHQSLGKALLDARKYFWEGKEEEHDEEKLKHNPLGLGYALYAPADIQISE